MPTLRSRVPEFVFVPLIPFCQAFSLFFVVNEKGDVNYLLLLLCDGRWGNCLKLFQMHVIVCKRKVPAPRYEDDILRRCITVAAVPSTSSDEHARTHARTQRFVGMMLEGYYNKQTSNAVPKRQQHHVTPWLMAFVVWNSNVVLLHNNFWVVEQTEFSWISPETRTDRRFTDRSDRYQHHKLWWLWNQLQYY